MSDDALRAFERAVIAEPRSVRAKLALWTAKIRAGRFPENPRGSVPAELDGGGWDEAFGYGGEPGAQNGADVCRVKRPGPVFPGDAVSVAPFTRKDVRWIFGLAEGDNDGPNWIALVGLWDERFVALEAGCDYTGWD